MTAIGFVTRTDNGGFRGQLKVLSICADIDIVPNRASPAMCSQIFASSLRASRSEPAGSGAARAAARTMSACHLRHRSWAPASSMQTSAELPVWAMRAASS